ncbi:hypothetical protein GPECTOR_40g557 [Gonium pectorale]|uniref:C3H1-type domain-containing protein n=1 Tax=Gonium pectorale TaxID=33097 RepID=A0A150GAN2_GONPE|nr:hypothetical protein GPECTOR_40g557 [Gonium pectorale]|eukprot:KXZ46823.1 hypothetical protein GPECTOR_40g557 [Gonium pectorale]
MSAPGIEAQRHEFPEPAQGDAMQALRNASLPDDFWLYAYKVLPCPHGYRHSWTHCPFSHAGETARRRCPRTHNYLPDACPNARAKRQCPNGDACPYAHNTFEMWLHPQRYRTRLCYLGANCRRPTCFFAHSVEELRSVDEGDGSASPAVTGMGVPPLALPPLPSPPPLPPPGTNSSAGDYSQPMGMGAPMLPTSMSLPAGALMPVVCMPQPQPGGGPLGTPPRPETPATYGPGMGGYGGAGGVPQVPRSPLPPPGEPLPPPHMLTLGGSPQLPPGQHMGVPMAMQMQMTMRPHPHHPHHAQHGMALHMGPPPPGTVYIARGLAPVTPGVHGLSSPPLGSPYMSPFGAPPAAYGGHGGGGNGYYSGNNQPPAAGGGGAGNGNGGANGRARSWSVPGEGFFVNGGGAAANAPEAMRQADAGFHAAGLPPGVAAVPAPVLVVSSGSSRNGGGGGGGSGGTPRHMPAPSNRAAAGARRMSTPNTGAASEATASAAAAAAAAAAAMRYPSAAVTTAAAVRGMSGGSASSGSPFVSPGAAAHGASADHHQQGKAEAAAAEAALRQLSLSGNSVAAPPPTPAALPTGDSSASSSAPPSAPLSVATSPTAGSPFAVDSAQSVGAVGFGGAASVAAGLLRAHSSPSGGAAAYAGLPVAGLTGESVAAAAAALAAVATGVESPAASSDGSEAYQALLQQMLRSASASAVEPPSAAALLPALLSGGMHLYGPSDNADGGGVAAGERTSDPGPSLRAAIRRMSSEIGYGAAATRQSDPGHGVAGGAEVQQLLLPLLQSVLTEGLASGQLELVNGQLQVKGSGAGGAGGSSRGSRLSASGSSGSTRHSVSVSATGCASPSLSVSSFGTE